MPKMPLALAQLPPSAHAALEKLGADLLVARLRRGESLATWAKQLGVSIPTLLRMESGEPGVAIGIYVAALYLIGRDGALVNLAAPETDSSALEADIDKAIALGRSRAATAALGRAKRSGRMGGDA